MKQLVPMLSSVVSATLLLAGIAWGGPTDAQKCEADKLKNAGKYTFCRMKAESKFVKKGDADKLASDLAKCVTQIESKFENADSKWGGACPTSGPDDVAAMQGEANADTDFLALKLSGDRYIDNGDGTVIDTQTGLIWEQKDDSGGIHDKDNHYEWSVSDSDPVPDGTVFTEFLAALDGGTSIDGTTINGCFAGYCDWRLPTSVELQTILLAPYPCPDPCNDPIFGPSPVPPSIITADYWSSTTAFPNSANAWVVVFENGQVATRPKEDSYYVRAVRGGS